MNRYISTIINKFSILLGFNGQENGVGSLAIQDFGLSSLLSSLGLRHGGGSSMAGLRVCISRVSSAMAAVPAHVHKTTSVGVPHCWRPVAAARHVSGKISG